MKAFEIEWRTYANSALPSVIPRFARGLLGAAPQPTANPFDAVCIDMEGRAAPSKPS